MSKINRKTKIVKTKISKAKGKINHILGFIASDHRGYNLKEYLKGKFPLIDLGTDSSTKLVDYNDYANKLSKYVLKERSMGILICGSGLGMSMAANRIKGIRAALCNNVGIAEMARYHNDANVLVLDGDFASERVAEKIVDRFFKAKFSNIARYKKRIKKLG